MKKRSPRVLLALDWHDHRLLQGIERFAQGRGWQLYGNLTGERSIPWGWDGDGVLTWLNGGEDLANFVAHIRKPTVDFGSHQPQLNLTRVLEDNAGAGGLVASHFLSCGLRRFLFYTEVKDRARNERGNGFQLVLSASGHDVRWLSWPESSAFQTGRKAWQVKRKWLAAEIKQAVKPLGIFAATDGLAYEVFEVCEAMGVRVPQEISIVGAGNSLPAVEAMATPISSVDTNLDALGYYGAQQLDRLMRGLPVPASPIRVPSSRLIVRKSSDPIAVANPRIVRSLRFLQEHYHESIRVTDLAEAAAMPLRSFHEMFTRQVGRTPGAEIQRFRVEKFKELLLGSDKRVYTIAKECGYRNGSSRLWSTFKETTGISPRQFRIKQSAAAKARFNGS